VECGGHLYKECLENVNSASTPACNNCLLTEREIRHRANRRGCRHTKKKMQKRKSQRILKTVRGWISPQTSPLQVCPSRRRYEAAQSNSSGLRHVKFQRQKTDCPGSCAEARNRSVSSGFKCKQSASRQYAESSNYSTADYDRVLCQPRIE
jgi:hypothetical protein